ncbi:UvrD-helicase-domain-containing protein [Amylocystis lapponica]|nr:UvrD-helicase-domain-containing protein [Amylocystis lapponica]
MSAEYLNGLNDAQSRAVLHPPQIPLQILAGPGSGKTKVLTSRIAHLITHHAIHPSAICAVTFTNKAANEMRERLTKLLGKHDTSQIKMGTFHALCASFLRRYAKDVGLEGNFTVCDADESKKIIVKLLKSYKDFLEERNITLKDGTIMSKISRAKAKGHSPEDLLKELAIKKRQGGFGQLTLDIDSVVAHIYKDYDKTLRRNNSLDFDDLLVFGVKLFSEHKKSAAWCRHVLVDEFQDTNIMQYDLMLHIASANRCVTIVGDPDQSIYGWRSAESTNLAKMQKDFPKTKQILLEQNYRSTAAILEASIAIVDQGTRIYPTISGCSLTLPSIRTCPDKTRVPKTLHTTHPPGPLPVLQAFAHEHAEAAFIAREIKRLAACMGGLLNWSDFVVLLRFNALSRTIESALQKEGIPSRVLAGHKFFERLEVKDLLAYLQLIDNPTFVPAFTRAINVPARALGEKTVAGILATAAQHKISPLAAAERIYDSALPDTKPPARRKLASFLVPMRRLRTLANEGTAPSVLIRELLELTEYEAHLRKTQTDWESRWENVQELLNFASEIERDLTQTAVWANQEKHSTDGKGKGRAMDVEEEEEGQEDTPLRLFLQASMLSTDTEAKDDETVKEKVTISTCHAAKGLEWPVVMVPAVERGTFPSSRAEDIEEERRLLYVACTRAQGLLYLSHSSSRMVAGEVKSKDLSEFIWAVIRGDSALFTNQPPVFQERDRALIAQVLHRPPPDEAEVSRKIAEYHGPP